MRMGPTSDALHCPAGAAKNFSFRKLYVEALGATRLEKGAEGALNTLSWNS